MAQRFFNGTKINVEFDEATSRQQLNSGENISTLFGKIKKIFSDLKAVCFSGSYNDLNDKPSALPANGGNSLTVNGHTVNSDVPYNAVFTDTVYNDTHIISALEEKSSIGHTHSRLEITDFPSALPANGGNADYATNSGNADTVDNVHISCTNDAIPNINWFAAFTNENNLRAIDPGRAYVGNAGNADTLDGLHADDFVNANDFNNYQIPNNADIPAWIYANGKRYKIYMTNGTNTGTTNIPNDSTDYVWYWFDGVNIIAREWTTGRYYICDTINGGFSGWKDVYTSGYKPYVTGQITVSYSTEVQSFTCLDFTPSAVICHHPERYVTGGTMKWATPITNGFSLLIGDTTANYVDYIAFK